MKRSFFSGSRGIQFRNVTLTVAVLGTLCLCGCSAGSHARSALAGETTNLNVAATEPTVLLVVSRSTCDWEGAGDLENVTSQDSAAVRSAFPAAKVVPASAAALVGAISSANRDRGLVLVYSGHGRDEPTRHGVSTQLCLEKPYRADDLVATISSHGFPWAVIALSACNSTFVDPSSSQIPLAVISASPLIVDTPPEGPSYLIHALMTAFTEARPAGQARDASESLDANCDGFLSDREWFMRAQSLLKIRAASVPSISEVTRAGMPEPQLRRQSPSEIPIWRIPHTGRACRLLRQEITKVLREIDDKELHSAVEDQLDLKPRRLPRIAYDFFRVSGRVVDCAARNDAELCRSVPRNFKQLPKFTNPTFAKSLAKFISFAEVYDVTEEQGWLHISRMRDERHMATLPLGEQWSALSRGGVWAEWADSDSIVRFTREVVVSDLPEDVGNSWANRTVSVCPSSEGQCFWLKK